MWSNERFSSTSTTTCSMTVGNFPMAVLVLRRSRSRRRHEDLADLASSNLRIQRQRRRALRAAGGLQQRIEHGKRGIDRLAERVEQRERLADVAEPILEL